MCGPLRSGVASGVGYGAIGGAASAALTPFVANAVTGGESSCTAEPSAENRRPSRPSPSGARCAASTGFEHLGGCIVVPILGEDEDDRGRVWQLHGRRTADNRMTQMVRNCVRAAGLGNIGSCHLFRHAMATQMLENGADVRFIQAMLGHADIKTTQVYTRVSIWALKDIHSATHPARLTRATLRLEDEPPATVADLLEALDAEAQADGEAEE